MVIINTDDIRRVITRAQDRESCLQTNCQENVNPERQPSTNAQSAGETPMWQTLSLATQIPAPSDDSNASFASLLSAAGRRKRPAIAATISSAS